MQAIVAAVSDEEIGNRLRAVIVPKGNGKASTFLLTLHRFGKRWLVNDWQPTGKMDIPLAN